MAVFNAKTRLVYGVGSSGAAGQEAVRLRIGKALLVTDKGIRASGLLDGIGESLEASGISYEVFDEVHADATVETMHEGATRASDTRCDGVIVVGGGSPICAARGIGLELANGEKVSKYEGVNRYARPPVPTICLPTTAGSGADVAAGFVVHDEAQAKIYAPRGDDLQPSVSILDPLLLRTCPRKQMVYSGLDALAHALDALWTKTGTPITDALACEAIRLILANLRKAALTDDLEAKGLQHLASTMASIACSNGGLGIVHGMTMYYGFKAPHGYQAGVLLPYGMEFNLPACEDKLARMALAIGEDSDRSRRDLAELAVRRVKELYIDLDFPRRFTEGEFPVEELPAMARVAMGNFFVQNTVRKASEEDVRRLYEVSLRGWVI